MAKDDQHIAELVQRAQSGDRESVAELFDLLSDRVFRYLRIRTPDRETAEDLTQTVFVEMIQALPRYRVQKNAKFTTWLFQLARFRLIDYYRRFRPSIPLDESIEPTDDQLAISDPVATERVTKALRQLPEQYQTVLHLKFQEDMSAADIATVLKTNAVNVRVIQHRALRALKVKLQQFNDHPRTTTS